MRSPRYPMMWQTWGLCGTCGMNLPSSYLIMTRKHSWQCLPNPLRSGYCFDGQYDRDDIYFVYPDDEGARDTAAPLADQNPGHSVTTYVFIDSVTGLFYAVDFAGSLVPEEIAEEDIDPDLYNGPFDWLEMANGMRLYMANASLRLGLFSTVYCPSAPGANQRIPTFAPAPDDIPIGPIVVPDLCESDTLVIRETFETELCPTPNLLTFEDFETELCETPNLLTFEDFELET